MNPKEYKYTSVLLFLRVLLSQELDDCYGIANNGRKQHTKNKKGC